MKGTIKFKETIEKYLLEKALIDEFFAETYKKENKNIDNCVTYILNQVKESDCNGFTDDEVYSMAVHYYDENSIDPGKPIDAEVVVNHKVELTDEELQEAKEDAKKRAENEQYRKMTKKIHVIKPVNKIEIQQSLF